MNIIKTEMLDEKPNVCAKCEKPIADRYLLKAIDQYWHENCLKCDICDCRLGDVGSSLYTRENYLLCRSDYMRLYGNTGSCSACHKLIPAFEMVMRAKRNVYHLECFACQHCNHRFCVGDRYYLCDNKILCESDYEYRMHQLNAQLQQQQNQHPADMGYKCPKLNLNNNILMENSNLSPSKMNLNKLSPRHGNRSFDNEFSSFVGRHTADLSPIIVR